jgi:hypothetical protein
MLNPCHVVVTVYGLLLLTEKSKFTAIVYVCISRWLYGTYLVIIINIQGSSLPFIGGSGSMV